MKPHEQGRDQVQQSIEPHELAGELTHEQRVALADGLVALYRRKVAEDEQKKAQEAVEG